MSLPTTSASMASSPTRSWATARLAVAGLLLLLYVGASTARWIHRTAWPPSGSRDEISLYERRFEALRPVLPRRGIIGYLGDPPTKGAIPEKTNAAALQHFRRYLLAQYALAPLLLVESTDPELVIGNFDSPAAVQAPLGFRLLRDFGSGVVLYRRAGS
jgi:hypothetical protein